MHLLVLKEISKRRYDWKEVIRMKILLTLRSSSCFKCTMCKRVFSNPLGQYLAPLWHTCILFILQTYFIDTVNVVYRNYKRFFITILINARQFLKKEKGRKYWYNLFPFDNSSLKFQVEKMYKGNNRGMDRNTFFTTLYFD